MPTLYEKVYGCLAASRVASAMGAAVEGWSPEQIEAKYGFVDRFYSYKHYTYRGVDWERMPGTTEDGIERQKLMCRAIITKQDRITVEDMVKTTIEVVDPAKAWYMSEPDDIKLVHFMKAGVPPTEVGSLSGWHGLNAMARASHAIGLINAGDPEGAFRDAKDVGRLLFSSHDIALVWAGALDAAIAHALTPGATVDSTIATALSFCTDQMKREIERALEIVARHTDYKDLRAEFYKIYNGGGIPYAASTASETVTKALAMFKFADGDARQGILYGVNFGRDTDCLAAMAGGLSGALSGIGAVPAEWVEQLDKATFSNPYTNIQCTIKEHADGIYAALQNRAKKMNIQIGVLTS
ncbi:MAG TPA: ADP-ribosylglycohydrolase family protein [Anaerolineaceae bacterium]